MRSLERFRFGLMASVCHAVVEVYGSGARNPATSYAQDNAHADGDAKLIQSMITITDTNSIGSLYNIADIPTYAIIDPRAYYDFAAITGVSDFDVGFRYPNGGAVIDADALVDGDDISSAGTQTLRGHGTLTLANSNKRVWQLAGLATDPGGKLSIYGTAKAAATATGVVNFVIPYSK